MKALLVYGDGSLRFIETECGIKVLSATYRDGSPREPMAEFHLMGVAHARAADEFGPQDAGTLIYAEHPVMAKR